MATLVSHAMRRYPITPPDAEYSSHNFRGTTSRQPWSQTQESESALSRSMRYAEPWLYGSVRAPSGFVLAPALVLCSCAEYINGTKRSSKKSPSVCKKCKGTRIPISNVESSKFGTVRCYPTAQVPTSTPVRAGTVRVSSKSRPSILPSGDPYDLMRRSRLSVPENSSQFRARSVSPNKIHLNESRSSSSTRIKLNTSVGKYSTVGRKSILECNVNPYDLMSLDTEPKDASITLVNGQRIRTRQQSTDSEYENIQVRRQQTHITSNQNDRNKVKNALLKLNEKESESNRFKSILKKPTTTFSDTDLNGGPERSPSPAHNKSGSHFYLPMPPSTPRKKVQFLVENEIVAHKENEQNCENFIPEDTSENENRSKSITPNTTETKSEKESTYDKGINRGNACKLRRSRSERVSQEPVKVVFHDTMALRSRVARNDSRAIFTERELEKLDGVSTSLRLKPFDVVRPRGPPPQPPNQSVDEYNCNKSNTSEIVANNSTLETMRKIVERENDSVNILNEICSNNSENSNLPDTTNSRNESQIDLEIPLKIFEASKNTTSLNDLQKSVDLIANDYANELQQDIIPPNTKSEAIISKNIENEPQAVIIDNSNECPIINITEQKTIITDVTPLDSTNDESNIDTPSAPPRKRSNNKQPVVITTPITQMIKIDAQSEIREVQNKTIVKINSNLNSTVHKLKIKNEFQDISYNTIEVRDTSKGKTSIMINGDDCYCTVNVSDDIPLYQSSVVVKDSGIKIESNSRKSSSVYITGNFVNSTQIIKEEGISFHNKLPNKEIDVQIGKEYEESIEKIKPNHSNIETIVVDNEVQKNLKLEKLMNGNNSTIPAPDNDYKDYSEQPVEICSADMLKQILNDPVEAVKRNLVPHVCGKSDVSRRPPRNKKNIKNNDLVASFLNDLNSTIDDFQVNPVSQLIEESFLKLRNHDVNVDDDKDACSEHSSSTQYELMDPGSDCYTDNSNRSSVTEEELSARSKFYELLAECAVEVSENEDHHYESIRANVDPIYEEIEIPPPLPSNPPPIGLLDDIHLDKEYTTRSIFEGASKYDILSYLVDAKERGIVPEDSYTYNFNNTGVVVEDDTKENITAYNRVSQMSTVSDSSEDSSLVIPGALIEDKVQRSIDIERNDSGVGSETSKCSLSKYRSKPELAVTCEDCEGPVDSKEDTEPLICRKCLKKRSERKEIITEIVETEEKYSRDLQIILEEFYQPMLVAGLLTSEQLSAIFLNVEELLENSQALAERLRDAVEIAAEQGDEDLLTVNIGKLILEAAPMLHAFETYCVRQGGASLLLAGLEKEKELLRIFLRVSQMENTVLRRMNLNSFLMVPVQRVTKYPLLLARLYKVTPTHHDTREQLKEAQHKIELHLNHMNSETKDIPSKLWRRISSYPGRRSSSEMDLVNIKLRKIAVDVLEWNHDEARFALEGKLLFTQPTDNNWRKGRTIKLTPVNALLVTNGKVSSSSNRPDPSDDSLIFSRHPGVREAALLLVRDKNGRYSLLREPLYLDRCVIAADPAWQSYFEVQELLGKDTFIFKADDEDQTRVWYRHLQYYAQGMGAWRKRRNALANIMINGMGLRS